MVHPNYNKINGKFLRILDTQMTTQDRGKYFTTPYLRFTFAKNGYNLQAGDYNLNQLHNFLKWCVIRRIFGKDKVTDNRTKKKITAYKINESKLNYYLKVLPK